MVSSGVGRGFDRYLASYFTNRGYVATKSAGSKGLADVIAIPPFPGASVLLVQAKAGDTHRITPKEWNGLYKLAEANPCITALAAFRSSDGPIFYELLEPLPLRTRQEKLPWKRFYLPGPRANQPRSPTPRAGRNGLGSIPAIAAVVTEPSQD